MKQGLAILAIVLLLVVN